MASDPTPESSLPKCILTRLKLVQQARVDPAEGFEPGELEVLEKLLAAREALWLHSDSFDETDEEDDDQHGGNNVAKAFDNAWMAASKFYVQRADLILCTAAKAASPF